ncbi:putative nuclease HARBI1 [Pangasianodon hypophthalmus]|uniref:putative nuclease HARBI1 n=1 Tax=Pangasianodon hypophthalmus TaxID=310915 RepID=UPI002307147F|nr:putative nuclease HARBI1 [Pangasianodon hypophthalmus]
MVSDSICFITNIEAKWPGSVHDSRIFRESFVTLFECGKRKLKCQTHNVKYTYAGPNGTSSFHYMGDYDGILLGDRGYPCRQYFMTPFPEPNPSPQIHYNAALVRTRARIEMTFRQLKGRFRCLKSLRVARDRACNITVACSVLHNIATIRKERTPVVEVQPDDDDVDPASARAAWGRNAEHHF